MTDAELRALVRAAVARHFGDAQAAPEPRLEPPAPAAAHAAHPSHALYLTLVNAGDACLIEPSVTCHHCGYSKSHGH